jgi:hypothetical protein
MMRRWQRRALVITFNKANKETMQQRIREARLDTTCDAQTLDGICRGAVGGGILEGWSDRKLCRTFWANSANSKFNENGPGYGSSKIVDFRFRHPRAKYRICKKHRRLGLKGHEWNAGFASYPMKHMIEGHYKGEGCATHASTRYVCDEQRSLSAKLNQYDVIIVDEMQDLISAQEQRLIFQTCKPVVLVGDPMQAINAFRDDQPCNECTLEQEEAPPLPCKIEWYGTWRLDGFTARFIEERFGRRMYSYRACDETAEIYWKDELVYKDNTLVMCRHTKNVVDTARLYQHMKVVNGDSLAGRLITASNDTSMVTPMAKYAQDLGKSGKLDSVCTLLRERTISLSNVKDMAAVTTVHQAKGFEYDHCAVHSDLLWPANEDEKNISFVAFTRHKKSLVVMMERNAC